jgi:hypothetical protein
MTLTEAAFALLEWAQHGQPLAELIENYENGVSSEEEDVMISDKSHDEVPEDQEEQEEEMPEWAQDVVNRKPADLEENEMESPQGLKVELRPYQKQALHWMTQQEATVGNHWKNDQWQLLKELAQMASKKYPSKDNSTPRLSGWDIYCDCGPVLVDVSSVSAPPVASVPSTYFDNPNAELSTMTKPNSNDHDTHPLWERHFLCNGTKSQAVSFFVQPFFRKATSIPPPVPSPCRGGILADSMGLVRK